MLKGVHFLVDDSGRRTVVQIDLKKQGHLCEDFHDAALAQERATEPRESLASVKDQVLGKAKTRKTRQQNC
ncbi:MAG: hypothetical protein ACR2IE_15885 [Candidatus Sumerlaeaceae bacterium]